MTSTYCTDCPYHDKAHPSLCCSNSVCPKPQADRDAQRYEDDEFNRLMQMRHGAMVIGEMMGNC